MTIEGVLLLDEAIEDLEVGRAFYETQEEGVGSSFVASLLSDTASLRIHAGTHAIHFGYHRLLPKRFPFAVYYEMESGTARVVAVLDMRRDPDTIRKIVQGRKRDSEE